jgi:hypothetical protein
MVDSYILLLQKKLNATTLLLKAASAVSSDSFLFTKSHRTGFNWYNRSKLPKTSLSKARTCEQRC